jgi:hypothetical protein
MDLRFTGARPAVRNVVKLAQMEKMLLGKDRR